ncbi:MAG TPA: acyl-ACP--UDP-N-acetylglucosamine O-acyltransferase [Alphaproteobacteria bacterium]|nr:acyl-ACP--UDP-N-acetylglucosamine O-acyltransferase [Alphaproteobacteria bacterium]
MDQTQAGAVRIHPSAIVDPRAEFGPGVEIGPYSIIGSDVRIGANSRIGSHVVIDGRTTIGPKATIFPFASIGQIPQDLKYKGEASELVIGTNNIIREHVTMNTGTTGGGMVTRVGDNCLFMVGAHVAHDCKIGDHVIMANNATLAGHVQIGEWAVLGGLCAVHQFARIGKHAMIGGMSGVEHDVIPYGSVMGNRARLAGLNIIGLKRRGFTRDQIHTLRTAYRLLFAQEGTMAERLSDVEEIYHDNEVVMEIASFIRADSNRAICQPRPGEVD